MLRKQISKLEIENAALRISLQTAVAANELILEKISHALRFATYQYILSTSLIERYYDRLEEDKLFGHLEKIKGAVKDSITIMDSFLIKESE